MRIIQQPIQCPPCGQSVNHNFQILIFCLPCISIYLFLNINQFDALNFIISLFQASTCFEHVFIVRRAKLYITVSGIITPVGVMIPQVEA